MTMRLAIHHAALICRYRVDNDVSAPTTNSDFLPRFCDARRLCLHRVAVACRLASVGSITAASKNKPMPMPACRPIQTRRGGSTSPCSQKVQHALAQPPSLAGWQQAAVIKVVPVPTVAPPTKAKTQTRIPTLEKGTCNFVPPSKVPSAGESTDSTKGATVALAPKRDDHDRPESFLMLASSVSSLSWGQRDCPQ